MLSKTDKLNVLLDFWYHYVNCDHHKERDCHFYIQKKWSYGSDLEYEVYHDGYMMDIPYKEFETYDEALTYLVESLETEIESVHRVPKDWESDKYDYNFAGVVKVINKFNLYPLTLTETDQWN